MPVFAIGGGTDADWSSSLGKGIGTLEHLVVERKWGRSGTYCRMVKGDGATAEVNSVCDVMPYTCIEGGVPLCLAVGHPAERVV